MWATILRTYTYIPRKSYSDMAAQLTIPKEKTEGKIKVKLLNAIPVSALPSNCTIGVIETNWVEACALINNSVVESYIGHASTASLISKMCGKQIDVNRSEAKLHKGDVAIVFALNRRVSGDVSEVRPEDFRILILDIY